MMRVRYLLVVVIVLAVVPWALDWIPSLSCIISTVDCLDVNAAAVSDEDRPPTVSAADTVSSRPAAQQPEAAVASSPERPRENHPRVASLQTTPTAAATRDIVVPQPSGVFSFAATREFGGIVTLKWHVQDETGIDYYVLDRKLNSDPDDAFERHITLRTADGSSDYAWTDTPPSDTFTYRLRALARTDQEDAGRTLGTADVTVEYVVGLTIGDFALGAASGLVSVNWTATQEGGVVSYVLDRKLEGAASYDLGVDVGYPQGDGTQYSLYDDPHGTGTYTYRLRAKLSNGTDRILAQGGVTL